MTKSQTGGAVLVFFAATAVITALIPPSRVGGSSPYFGTCAMLFVLSWWCRRRRLTAESRTLFFAGLAFVISLTFRSVDRGVCPGFPLGTHFLWHIINAAVIYMASLAGLSSATQAHGGRERYPLPGGCNKV